MLKRLGPLMYYEAQLWRPELSFKDKMGFLNSQQYQRRLAQLNPVPYRKLSQHKVTEKALLQLAGIPTPAFAGFFHPQKGFAQRGEPLRCATELSDMLSLCIGKTLCFKPTEGWGGSGFVAAQVKAENERLYLIPLGQNEKLSVPEFVSRYLRSAQGMLIEHYLVQHSVMADFNPDSVNTLRIWVKQTHGEAQVLGVILRIGRRHAVVDNASQGGFIARVNMMTGQLQRAMTTELLPVEFDTHPDSGVQLTGRQLPYWDECLALARKTLSVFPHSRFAGLDMAISKTGPVIIELNLEPDKVTARNFGLPLKQLLS
ncbi:hypothetical protein AT746_07825 [Lacimicrobium alkaliphilum]|uniref:Alpha-L-glutamate ligase-related protein ATP-grasp domain-containing protein n=2 Tax=Lacimicrobium alkaliphilum TaxID=1526571 RepID=A0A0U3AAY2_9ALTE|nr:hypothetical protein AT746_07825 [Lacimicrobium alkaliphilum]